MSDSIWKTRDEEPKKYPILALGDDGKYYVFESPKLGTGDLGWKHRCHDYVKQYCYIDDLIAQVDKVELLQKSAETLKEFITKLYLNGNITDEQLEIYKNTLKNCQRTINESRML